MGAIISYLLVFAVVYLAAMLTDALAPTFNGEKHMPSALKLIAYSLTVLWLAAAVATILSLSLLLAFIGLIIVLAALVYAIYTIYLGVPALMRAPQDKAVGYTLVIIVGTVVIGLVLGGIRYAIGI